jgi:hypothetical protein
VLSGRVTAIVALALANCACVPAGSSPEQQARTEVDRLIHQTTPTAVIQAVANRTPDGDIVICGYWSEPAGRFLDANPFVFRRHALLSRSQIAGIPLHQSAAICGKDWVAPTWPQPIS